ncbi:TIM barrel protein [Desulfogranum japonicum]|uniref:TIM barrel protein n=1 Tax=Desulfogranum japonicum TaxID=231447 RepID=UPI000420F6B4|nr:TIM barrel protein [Desulfogranum japonicum]
MADSDSRGAQTAYTNPFSDITLAASTQWHAFPARFDWLASHGFAMEYTPNGEALEETPKHLAAYLGKNIPVRHHAFFPGFELGDADQSQAEKALALHKHYLDTIIGNGEQVVTVHVGLVPDIALNHERVQKNLSNLVEYGATRGVTVSLENLRFGATSNPETVIQWAGESGASITLDVGHAVSCERVQAGELTVPHIVEMFSHKLEEVHLYEYETDTHYAPHDMSVLGPIVDALLQTDCRWWTIELTDVEEILTTRELVHRHVLDRH